MLDPIPPLLHEILYGETPPVTEILHTPLEAPQVSLIKSIGPLNVDDGSLMLICCDEVHPLPLVTTQLY